MSEHTPQSLPGAASSDHLGAKMVAGGLSCMFISFILNPMDVIKVRLQTQSPLPSSSPSPSPPSPSSLYHNMKYRGFSHAFGVILREEGYFRGLMKGVHPSLLREASYSSIRMGLYDALKGIIAPAGTTKDEFTLLQKILAGGLSGALGSAIATPVDVVKIRFQTYTPTNPNPYKHTLHAFYTIASQGGIRALYKGAVPNVVRASILTSSQLSSYDQCKRALLHSGYFGDTPLTHLVAAIVSSLIATTAVNPADVVKTRIMSDGHVGGAAAKYANPLDCLVQTWRHEGAIAFMKGWTPNYMRLGPHFLVSLPLAEFIRKKLGADTF